MFRDVYEEFGKVKNGDMRRVLGIDGLSRAEI